MLPEILLILAGYESALVSLHPSTGGATSYELAPAYTEGHFHPGEVTSLTTLALVGFRYRKVSGWIGRAQKEARKEILRTSAPSRSSEAHQPASDGRPPGQDWQYLAALCTRVKGILQEYDDLLVWTEERMLAEDDGFCGEEDGFIPLSTLLATYAVWQQPLAALANLVDALQAGPPSQSPPSVSSSAPSSSTLPIPHWPPGPLIDLLNDHHLKSETNLAKTYQHLSHAVQLAFLSQLLVFLLHGQPCSLAYDAGPDPLAPSRRLYKLREGAMPSVIGTEVRESVLWTGRAIAVVRQEGRELPADMKARLEAQVRAVWLENEQAFQSAVDRVRAEVGEWLWHNILTKKDVKRAVEAFGDIFLGRDGELALAFVREVEELKISKLIRTNPSSTSAIIREQDINLALLRASVGTASASNPVLEKVHFVLEKGALRPFLPSISASKKHPSSSQPPASSSSESLRLFSSHLLGTPLVLTSTLSWPLDLFLTPQALVAYSTVFAYLTALRRTHSRVLGLWLSLSGAQRTRRKWTGVGEGGEENRKKVARMGWEVVRLMVWFLDSIMSHFQTDVIDVQHRAFLAKLQNATTSANPTFAAQQEQTFPSSRRTAHGRTSSATSTTPASPTHPHFQPHSSSRLPPRAQSPLFQTSSAPFPPGPPSTHFSASQTARTSPIPPTSPTSTGPHLDFLTLRVLHSNYLGVLHEGLLLSNPEMAQTIKDVLDVCERFVGVVERWGGDVLPGLLEVELEEEGAASVGREVDRRGAMVAEIRDTLQASLATFFAQLAPSARTPAATSAKEDPSNTSVASRSGAETSFAALTLSGSSKDRRSGQTSSKSTQKRPPAGGIEQERAELEADVATRRHLEQLAVRLDFLGTWFNREEPDEDEEGEEGDEPSTDGDESEAY